MNPTLDIVLYWTALLGAIVALALYFVQIAIRPKWVRLVNGAGLFFTGLALAEVAMVMRALAASSGLGAVVIVLALLAAIYFQGAASLRGRSGDRRAS